MAIACVVAFVQMVQKGKQLQLKRRIFLENFP